MKGRSRDADFGIMTIKRSKVSQRVNVEVEKQKNKTESLGQKWWQEEEPAIWRLIKDQESKIVN